MSHACSLYFLFALFALFTTAASAEWVKVAESDIVVVYIDPATIRKDRHLRQVWDAGLQAKAQ